MPVDVVKVRLQYQGGDGTVQYRGMVDAFRGTMRNEGPGALFKGIKPAMVRQFTYGGLRYGLYAPIRNMIGVDASTPKSEIPLAKKFIAGGGAGAISSFICNPTDLLKIRMQVDGMKAGSQSKYTGSMIQTMRSIVKEDGVTGLWRGAGPTVGRATALAAVEMSSYDHIKTFLIKQNIIVPGTASGVFVTAVCSGFCCAVATSPLDVVKSRVMGQPVGPDGVGELYKGMVDCFVKSVKGEGILSLWKGFLPNWGRLGPRGVICFLVMEGLNETF